MVKQAVNEGHGRWARADRDTGEVGIRRREQDKLSPGTSEPAGESEE